MNRWMLLRYPRGLYGGRVSSPYAVRLRAVIVERDKANTAALEARYA